MRSLLTLSLLATYVSANGLLPIDHNYASHAWVKRDIPNADTVVSARIYARQPEIERAAEYLDLVSDPNAAEFGQHLERREAERFFRPSAESLDAIATWLKTSNVSTISSHSSNVIQFEAKVKEINGLFGGSCAIYDHTVSDTSHVSCDDIVIPVCLQDHVDHITINGGPQLSLAQLDRRADVRQSVERRSVAKRNVHGNRADTGLSRCANSWTPECIRELYQIPLNHNAAPNNSIGIYGYGDLYIQSDLNEFFKRYASFIPNNTTPTKIKINTVFEQYTIGEENLDLEMSYPIVYPQNITMFQVGDAGSLQSPGFGNAFLDAVDKNYCHKDGGDDPQFDPILPNFSHPFNATCGTVEMTNVLSISYSVDEYALDTHYIRRQCNEWMKLALQGKTVLVASGDRGVQGSQYCGKPINGTDYDGFVAGFPASCPYVTAVGATQVNFTADGSWKEVAVDDYPHKFWSGGGFSNTSVRRAYQDAAVKGYFAKGQGRYPSGTYNRNGRAYPDVSMLGALVSVFDAGEDTVSGGTSAATPLFASIINRINDDRLLAGKKPIGFLNSILYQHPEVFRDITQGHNPGCEAPGFNATTGWDPVSGLGAPVYPLLHDLLVNLP